MRITKFFFQESFLANIYSNWALRGQELGEGLFRATSGAKQGSYLIGCGLRGCLLWEDLLAVGDWLFSNFLFWPRFGCSWRLPRH